MSRLALLIRWSDAETYECVATLEGETFTLTCTCAAGQIGQLCRHRMMLLAGEDPGIVGENSEACRQIPRMLEQAAELYRLHQNIQLTELHIAKTTRRCNELKQQMARLLGTP